MNAGTAIVGGGLAAQRCAETLRRLGYDDPIRIVCAEDVAPYDRPPLSKEALAAGVEQEALAFRPESWYREHEVELLLGSPAAGLDPAAGLLGLEDGVALSFDRLVIATGGAARGLPLFEGRPNVHTLRTAADSRRLRAQLGAGARLAIVGAGFIGQEVAATALELGAEVTVIEALPVPLEPILGAELGARLARMHLERGVRLELGSGVAGARGADAVEELVLDDGRRVACDLVLVGVGTVPATGWLEGSGLNPGGVRTDHAGRTGLAGIYAAGDASVPFEPRFGEYARTEHWDAAAWQGAAVAKAILGREPGMPPLPSFWSDMYGHRIQYVGHARHADDVRLEDDDDSPALEAVFTRAGAPVAALTIDRARSIPGLRDRIERGHSRPLEEVG